MAEKAKRVDVRLGSFACSIEGFDDPAAVLDAVLDRVRAALATEPRLPEAPALLEAEAREALLSEAAVAAGLPASSLEVLPGTIVLVRASGAEPAAEADPEAMDEAASRLDDVASAEIRKALAEASALPADAIEAGAEAGRRFGRRERQLDASPPSMSPSMPPATPLATPSLPTPAEAAEDPAVDEVVAAAEEALQSALPASEPPPFEPSPLEPTAEQPPAESHDAEIPAAAPVADPVAGLSEPVAVFDMPAAEPMPQVEPEPEPERAPEPEPAPAEEEEPLVLNIFAAPLPPRSDPPAPETAAEPVLDVAAEPAPTPEPQSEPEPAPEPEAEPSADTPPLRLSPRRERRRSIFAGPEGGDEEESLPPEPQPAQSERITPQALAFRMNASDPEDQLLCAAAWLTFAALKPRFSRREVFDVMEQMPANVVRNLEVRIKGFGRLVRDGAIKEQSSGIYMLSDQQLERVASHFE
ncbi:MAG: hypothetical protein AAGF76_10800 [Pseudomonadota bacterium]